MLQRSAGEVIVPLPERVPMLSAVRSTLLVSSVQLLKENGLFDRYVRLAARAVREEIEGAVAGGWVDARIVQDHYLACDALGLSASEQFALSKQTFARLKGTLFGTAVKFASLSGATPWTLAEHLPRFWARAYQGGALGITRTGPKDARVDVVGLPLIDIAYYRNGYRGLSCALVELFCAKCVVTELRENSSPSSRSFRVQYA